MLKFAHRALVFGINFYLIGLGIYLLLRLTTADQFWWLALLNNFLPFYFLPLLVLLPLALILRAKRTLAMTVIFAAIGAVWFAPRFVPRASAAANGDNLRVVTFNLWYLNQHFDEVEQWIRSTGADMVVLQEVTEEHVNNLLPRLEDIYPYQHTRYRALLSRHPIMEIEEIADEAVKRFTLDVKGQTITVYNVHLSLPLAEEPHLPIPIDSAYLEWPLSYDDTLRNQQIQQLLARVEGESNPYIVAGDFNMSDQTAIYPVVASQIHDSFIEAGYGLGLSWPKKAYEQIPDLVPPLVRIDYIWHSDHFQATRAEQGPRLGSDHLPLMADLALNN